MREERLKDYFMSTGLQLSLLKKIKESQSFSEVLMWEDSQALSPSHTLKKIFTVWFGLLLTSFCFIQLQLNGGKTVFTFMWAPDCCFQTDCGSFNKWNVLTFLLWCEKNIMRSRNLQILTDRQLLKVLLYIILLFLLSFRHSQHSLSESSLFVSDFVFIVCVCSGPGQWQHSSVCEEQIGVRASTPPPAALSGEDNGEDSNSSFICWSYTDTSQVYISICFYIFRL